MVVKMFKVAIVEDEISAADKLSACLRRYAGEKNLKFDIIRFGSAVDLLNNYAPIYDIIFMDIMLPYLNGMDAAKSLREMDGTVTLIFVTNMINFAVKGYEVDALDFIVKPVVYDFFAMKMNRAVKAAINRKGVGEVTIAIEGSMKILPVSELHYIEVSLHNLIYHSADGIYKTRGSMTAVEKQLRAFEFLRCNVCYLVNPLFVAEVAGDNVIMRSGEKLKISRAKKKEFMTKLTNFFGRGI